jgi:sulfur relay (sulfurtransferase) complex TusBCD TusD component (DsrE family)
MATATNIHLSPATDSGIYSSNVREDAARTASEVLQEDMEKHHVFFNEEGFHSMFQTSLPYYNYS